MQLRPNKRCNVVQTAARLDGVSQTRDNWPAQRVEIHFGVIQVGVILLIVCDRVGKGHSSHKRHEISSPVTLHITTQVFMFPGNLRNQIKLSVYVSGPWNYYSIISCITSIIVFVVVVNSPPIPRMEGGRLNIASLIMVREFQATRIKNPEKVTPNDSEGLSSASSFIFLFFFNVIRSFFGFRKFRYCLVDMWQFPPQSAGTPQPLMLQIPSGEKAKTGQTWPQQ